MFWRNRWHALWRLGEALTRVAERAEIRRVQAEDAARDARLGDLEGQTARAMAFADKLEGSVLVEVVDPVTVTPHGWGH